MKGKGKCKTKKRDGGGSKCDVIKLSDFEKVPTAVVSDTHKDGLVDLKSREGLVYAVTESLFHKVDYLKRPPSSPKMPAPQVNTSASDEASGSGDWKSDQERIESGGKDGEADATKAKEDKPKEDKVEENPLQRTREMMEEFFDDATAEEIISAKDFFSHEVPLLCAVAMGHEEGVRKLAEGNAELNVVRAATGNTAVHVAVIKNHISILKILINAGADLKPTNKEGNNAFMVAISMRSSSAVNILWHHKNTFSIHQTNKRGETALHQASLRSWESCINMLIAVGASKNCTDLDGCTPLAVAVKNRHNSAIKCLLKNGADVLIEDNDSCSPLCLAMSKERDDIVQSLVESMSEYDMERYITRRIELLQLLQSLDESSFYADVLYPICRCLGQNARSKNIAERLGLISAWVDSLQSFKTIASAMEVGIQGISDVISPRRDKLSSKGLLRQFLQHGGPDLLLWLIQQHISNTNSTSLVCTAVMPILAFSEVPEGRRWLEKNYHHICEALQIFDEDWDMCNFYFSSMEKRVEDRYNRFMVEYNKIREVQAEKHGAELLQIEEQERLRKDKKKEKKKQKRQHQKTKVTCPQDDIRDVGTESEVVAEDTRESYLSGVASGDASMPSSSTTSNDQEHDQRKKVGNDLSGKGVKSKRRKDIKRNELTVEEDIRAGYAYAPDIFAPREQTAFQAVVSKKKMKEIKKKSKEQVTEKQELNEHVAPKPERMKTKLSTDDKDSTTKFANTAHISTPSTSDIIWGPDKGRNSSVIHTCIAKVNGSPSKPPLLPTPQLSGGLLPLPVKHQEQPVSHSHGQSLTYGPGGYNDWHPHNLSSPHISKAQMPQPWLPVMPPSYQAEADNAFPPLVKTFRYPIRTQRPPPARNTVPITPQYQQPPLEHIPPKPMHLEANQPYEVRRRLFHMYPTAESHYSPNAGGSAPPLDSSISEDRISISECDSESVVDYGSIYTSSPEDTLQSIDIGNTKYFDTTAAVNRNVTTENKINENSGQEVNCQISRESGQCVENTKVKTVSMVKAEKLTNEDEFSDINLLNNAIHLSNDFLDDVTYDFNLSQDISTNPSSVYELQDKIDMNSDIIDDTLEYSTTASNPEEKDEDTFNRKTNENSVELPDSNAIKDDSSLPKTTVLYENDKQFSNCLAQHENQYSQFFSNDPHYDIPKVNEEQTNSPRCADFVNVHNVELERHSEDIQEIKRALNDIDEISGVVRSNLLDLDLERMAERPKSVPEDDLAFFSPDTDALYPDDHAYHKWIRKEWMGTNILDPTQDYLSNILKRSKITSPIKQNKSNKPVCQALAESLIAENFIPTWGTPNMSKSDMDKLLDRASLFFTMLASPTQACSLTDFQEHWLPNELMSDLNVTPTNKEKTSCYNTYNREEILQSLDQNSNSGISTAQGSEISSEPDGKSYMTQLYDDPYSMEQVIASSSDERLVMLEYAPDTAPGSNVELATFPGGPDDPDHVANGYKTNAVNKIPSKEDIYEFHVANSHLMPTKSMEYWPENKLSDDINWESLTCDERERSQIGRQNTSNWPAVCQASSGCLQSTSRINSAAGLNDRDFTFTYDSANDQHLETVPRETAAQHEHTYDVKECSELTFLNDSVLESSPAMLKGGFDVMSRLLANEVPSWSSWRELLQRFHQMSQFYKVKIGRIMLPNNFNHFIIGRSASGNVVTVGMLDDQHEVAVKRVARNQSSLYSPQLNQWIQNKLQHPNLLPYLHLEKCSLHAYLVTELCELNLESHVITLGRLRIQNGCVETAIAARLVKEVFQGLDYLHKHDIVHGRLKPQNVLIDAIGRVRLSDFGLHNSQGNDRNSGKPTLAEDSVITAIWTTPEGHGVKADMQIAGMLVYYIMTGGDHAYGTSPSEQRAMMLRRMPSLRRLTDEADDLLQRLLLLSPQERPTAAAAIRHPLLWEDEEKIFFMNEVSKAVCQEENSGSPKTIRARLMFAWSGRVKTWTRQITHELLRELELMRGQRYRSDLPDLLQLMSNIVDCYTLLTEENKRRVGEPTNFILKIFPWATIEIYKLLRPLSEGLDSLTQFFDS